jgi:hypothetical protein
MNNNKAWKPVANNNDSKIDVVDKVWKPVGNESKHVNDKTTLAQKWGLDADKMEGMEKDWRAHYKDKLEHFPSHLLYERSPDKRRYVAANRLRELSDVMPELPDKDTDYYIMATGCGKRIKDGDVVHSFGFGNFIEYIISKFGNGCTVYISTWSMNLDHAYMLLELLDNGGIGRLHILSDPSIFNRKFEIMAMLKSGMERFDGNRVMMFRNHSKVLCVSSGIKDRFCTVTGSANLSGNPRLENYTVSSSSEMYQFFVDNVFEVIFDLDTTSK